MKKKSLFCAIAILAPMSIGAQVIVETDTYRWHGDTVTQGEFQAVAVTPHRIVSGYHPQPGYYMGIEPEWNLQHDISSYPQLVTPNTLHQAIYNMALDEMVGAVEPDTTLRTGKAWGGVWTRDVSYSIILSMAYLQPEASRISLMKKVDSLGRIIQDTGSGGAWPISSDREIWAVAAYEVYKATGDREWLEYIYPIIKRSLDDDALVVVDPENGLVKGETSFIDWREQSHPRWMQTADIAQTNALGTSIVHVQALKVLSEIANELGHKSEAADYAARAKSISDAVNNHLWMDDKGYYAMYLYGRDNKIANPRAETLGESLAILWDIAPADRAARITASNPTTPFGVAIFFPQIADMPPYHNNALWPWVASYWAMANAKAGNEQGTLEAIGSIVRPAALFCTNKENFVLDNGDIATQLNSSNMLWCLSGNIALTHKILFGIDFQKDGLAFHPFIPKALAATRSLNGFTYRDATLDITVSGYGNKIKSFTLNGKPSEPFIPSSAKGKLKIDIVMADNDITPIGINHTANVKAPLTPISWFEGDILQWNPIEYINHYQVLRNGEKIAETRSTTFDATIPSEYQIIGVADDGTQSFASEPRDNRPSLFFEVPGAQTAVISSEVAYPVEGELTGYTGQGFVEIDHSTSPLMIPITVDTEGDYIITFRYANGNGSVNTENKAVIRTLSLNGSRLGTVTMPQRGVGYWCDWGYSTPIKAHLDKGSHMLTLTFEPENENMNIKTNHALIDGIKLTLTK